MDLISKALFWTLKEALQGRGDLTNPHQCAAPTGVMHGRQSAPERSPHTSWRWRVRGLMSQPIIQEDDKGARLKEPGWARTPGKPLLFDKCPGIFKDLSESGPRFNVSSEGRNDDSNITT